MSIQLHIFLLVRYFYQAVTGAVKTYIHPACVCMSIRLHISLVPVKINVDKYNNNNWENTSEAAANGRHGFGTVSMSSTFCEKGSASWQIHLTTRTHGTCLSTFQPLVWDLHQSFTVNSVFHGIQDSIGDEEKSEVICNIPCRLKVLCPD